MAIVLWLVIVYYVGFLVVVSAGLTDAYLTTPVPVSGLMLKGAFWPLLLMCALVCASIDLLKAALSLFVPRRRRDH